MKLILFANTDWYLYNFRCSLALALIDAGHEVLLLSPDGPYGDKLRRMGLRWESVSMDRRSLNPWREAAFLIDLYRLFRRERPDLVHGFTLKCAVYGSIAARLAGVRGRVNAVTGMGYVFTNEGIKARLLRPLVKGLMKLALDGHNARLVLQNPDDRALFIQAQLVHPDRIHLIPGSGVDCSRFRPATSTPEGSLKVLLPARLLWDKGLAEFVAAARELKGEGRDIRFQLAGEPDPGNPASVPEATVGGWVDEGVIERLGHVDNMPALFNSVHVVALPSYREGLPKGLIEAGACACALVTTDVPGCRDVVSDGVDGLLVTVRDPRSLARAIARLADDPALRARLGQAARAKALEQFNSSSINTQTQAIYETLVSAR